MIAATTDLDTQFSNTGKVFHPITYKPTMRGARNWVTLRARRCFAELGVRHSLAIGVASLLVLACGGKSETHAREQATDGGVTPRHDAGSLDAPVTCAGFSVRGTLAGQAFEYCRFGEKHESNDPFDAGWLREATFGPDLTGLISMKGAAKPVDGQPLAPDRGLVRMPSAGPLGGQWLCGSRGSLTPYLTDGTEATPEPYDLGALSDLGICRGDASLRDWVRFDFRSLNDFSVTGSIQGKAIEVTSLGMVCYVDYPICHLYVGPTDEGSRVFMLPESLSDAGGVTDLIEAAWLAPLGIGADLLCAGPGSTLSRDGSHLVVELRGVRSLNCPGETEAGQITGTF
jgi:hypothetical protein